MPGRAPLLGWSGSEPRYVELDDDEIFVEFPQDRLVLMTSMFAGGYTVSLRHSPRIWPKIVVAPRLERLRLGWVEVKDRVYHAWWTLRHGHQW